MEVNNLSIRNLKIMVALNALCYGLIYPFISTYIVKIGGSYFHAGIFSVGNLIGEISSAEIIKILIKFNGKRYALFFILNIAMITHLLLAITYSYWFTIIIRILFSLVNQCENICSSLLEDRVQNGGNESKELLRGICDILNGAGYIIGPILSGYIFDQGFGYVTTLAAFLTLINITLLMQIAKDGNDNNLRNKSNNSLMKRVYETFAHIKKSDYQKHWDILLTKYLFSSSILIFFSKFSQILKANYQSSSSTIGYVTSYINILIFTTTNFGSEFKVKTHLIFGKFSSEISAFLLTVSLLLTCYAPNYRLFLLFTIPIVYLRTFVINLWPDLFVKRQNNSLTKLNYPTGLLAGLVTPLLFGLTRDKIGVHAVVIFSCVPMGICWIINRFFTRNIENVLEDKKYA